MVFLWGPGLMVLLNLPKWLFKNFYKFLLYFTVGVRRSFSFSVFVKGRVRQMYQYGWWCELPFSRIKDGTVTLLSVPLNGIESIEVVI